MVEQQAPASKLKAAALGYARAGWAVFPVRPGTKVPATANGHLAATTDLEQITAWWQDNPSYNIAMPMAANGLVAVDADTYKPECGWAGFAAAHEVPPTRIQRSASGGVHYLFKSPSGAAYPGQLVAGVDVKHQGYLLVAPSVFNGKAYRWETSDAIAPAPDWLRGAQKAQSGSALGPGSSSAAGGVDQAALIGNLLKGETLHDSARDLAASLAAQGTPAGAITSLLMGLSHHAAGVEPQRAKERQGDLYRLAKSAVAKFGAEPVFSPKKEQKENKPQYKFLHAADVKPVSSPYWIKGVLPKASITAVYGGPKAGKSFICLDLACCLARGGGLAGPEDQGRQGALLGGGGACGLCQPHLCPPTKAGRGDG